MSPNISCLIYDMDGLLLDTEGIYTEVTQQIVGEYGKVFDWSVKEKIIGRRSIQAAEIIVESLDLPISPQDYLDSRKDVLLEKFKDTEALPGAKEMTTHFFKLGIPQALATSSSSPMFEAKFEKHKKWFSQFAQIVRGDDPELKEGKPAPDIFLLAANRVGVDPAECLVFEDAPTGTEAALAAGMSVVVVPDPNMDHCHYKNASQIISSLKDFDPEYWGLPKFAESI
ncbi:MAG: HAD-IA family hydrolase [Candidatus Lambdaproteobacteria bacterium]|jgi:pseudouridine-5'-monophosphatase|nr:HAD family hydrolase [Candidatus Lambdaproteobacteria bacterium]